jgi:myo-inositol-1(or 4)-monophosphatase
MTDREHIAALTAVLGGALKETRRAPREARRKGPQDYVTDVDLALDRRLAAQLPAIVDVPVLSEERAETAPAGLETYWIVDPLDGTANLIAGLPFYAISVALVDRDGPRLAAVASGADAAIWTAVRGAGAARNGVRLWLPDMAPSELIVISTGLLDQLSRQHPQAYEALRKIGKIRNLGSQALHLCGVAAGQFAAVLSREARVWDEAAGGLILREAGGDWRSAADGADWGAPAALMALEQCSSASHPACTGTLDAALAEVFPDRPPPADPKTMPDKT